MPHLVTSLFRSSSHGLEPNTNLNQNPQNHQTPLPSSSTPNISATSSKPTTSSATAGASSSSARKLRRPSLTSSRSSFTSSRSSADNLHSDAPPTTTSSFLIPRAVAAKMTGSDSNPKEHRHHRLSFAGLHLGRSHNDTPPPPPEASLDWEVETPPVMLHGRNDESTGALVSGQVKLEVKVDRLEVVTCTAAVNLHVLQKKPFQTHCFDCQNQVTKIQSFDFLSNGPLTLERGVHQFPFSALIDGHLPATIESSLGSFRYEFVATAKTASGATFKLEKPVPVRRSIPEAGQDHHSVRVFPPTNIAANVYYPSVIHPGHENILRLHMNGLSRVVPDNPKNSQIEYWKLKKLSWRIDEKVRFVAPACAKHTPATPGSASAGRKGLVRTDLRHIGNAELVEGWKTAYSPHDSEMEIDLKYRAEVPRRLPNTNQPQQARPLCDLSANDGTEVIHGLVVEMVVVQEVASLAHPSHFSPTGIARILRMHFSTTVTEESADGDVAWDCEAPPIYEDVPPSPPAYPVEDAPSYDSLSDEHSMSGGGEGSGSGTVTDPLVILRRESAAQGGLSSLPEVIDSGSATGSNTSVLEARGSSEGRAPSFGPPSFP